MIKTRRMRWDGHVTYMGESSYTYKISIGEREWKRKLDKPRC
jgi:hypothetical protein